MIPPIVRERFARENGGLAGERVMTCSKGKATCPS